jgi:hypothetical protein
MPAETKKPPDSVQRKGVCLHASSVNVSGQALLFLGHSTAGKSTISRLLSERYPVIADDKVWVYQIKNGDWVVHDGSDNFHAGNGHECPVGRDQYPLLAVLRIFKANTTQIVPLSKKETCRYLMDAVFEIDFQRKVEDLGRKKSWFSCVAEISRKIKGWRLTFKKDASIIDIVNERFEQRFYSVGPMTVADKMRRR